MADRAIEHPEAARARRRGLFAALAFAAVASLPLLPHQGWAQSGPPLQIGVLNDSSGPTAALSGLGSVTSAEMAVEDFGGTVLGRPIQLLKADHQAKADLGIGIARRWFDDDVRAVFDIGITTVALGVQQLAKDKNKIAVFTSTGTVDLTGKSCSPNGIHWTYDSYAFAVGAARANMAAGGKRWFFLTVDYAYGRSLQDEATKYIEGQGGSVVGLARHPFETKDFSSDLLKAQGSGADTIGLATPTAQISAIVKQAAEFGVGGAQAQRLAPIGLLMNDVKGLGLAAAQGLLVTEPFYWDQTDETRRFADRFRTRTGYMPNSYQASVYGAVTHYLKAVKAAGTDDSGAVLATMKSMPVEDFMTKGGTIRPDGRLVREMHIFRVKTPAESKSEWDLFQPVSTIPPNEAFKAPDPACPLVK